MVLTELDQEAKRRNNHERGGRGFRNPPRPPWRKRRFLSSPIIQQLTWRYLEVRHSGSKQKLTDFEMRASTPKSTHAMPLPTLPGWVYAMAVRETPPYHAEVATLGLLGFIGCLSYYPAPMNIVVMSIGRPWTFPSTSSQSPPLRPRIGQIGNSTRGWNGNSVVLVGRRKQQAGGMELI